MKVHTSHHADRCSEHVSHVWTGTNNAWFHFYFHFRINRALLLAELVASERKYAVNFWKIMSKWVLFFIIFLKHISPPLMMQVAVKQFTISLVEIQNLAIVDIQCTPNEQLEQLTSDHPLTKISYFQTDITDETALRTTFHRINDHFECIDILINAAGIFNDKNIDLTFKVNVVIRIEIFFCLLPVARIFSIIHCDVCGCSTVWFTPQCWALNWCTKLNEQIEWNLG